MRPPLGRRDLDHVYLTNALINAHGEYPELGCRLLARLGETVGEAADVAAVLTAEAVIGDRAAPARHGWATAS
ncbi:MAG: hypothetical protein ABI181_05690 [Mycobacteriaceae bacterium]